MSAGSLEVPRAAPGARPHGWWGTLIFLASEATLFGTLIGSYFFLRFKSVHWPPPGIDPPKIAVPLLLTGVLVATSVSMQAAFRLAKRDRIRLAWLAVLVSLVVQAGYFAMQVHLYQDDLERFSPRGSAYGSIYFTLLGTHHGHVAAGLLLDVWLLLRLARGTTRYRLVGLRSTALYWHVVNALALAVVGTQLSPHA